MCKFHSFLKQMPFCEENRGFFAHQYFQEQISFIKENPGFSIVSCQEQRGFSVEVGQFVCKYDLLEFEEIPEEMFWFVC